MRSAFALTQFSSAARRFVRYVAGAAGSGIAGIYRMSANVGSFRDFQPLPTYVDLFKVSRGFTLTTDPYGNSAPRPTLDANGYPTQDFAVTVPQVPVSASVQTLKCFLGGAATIAVGGAAGFSIANQLVTGDTTTFDFVIAANNAPINGCTLTFTSTKRTAASAINTGATAMVIKSPGYTLADTTVFIPAFTTYLSRFSTLRFMDNVSVNGDLTTILTTDRSTSTKFIPFYMPLEDCAALCNVSGQNLWFNIPAAASDALVTAYATAALAAMPANKYTIFELSNENWNYTFAQHNYWMDQAMALVNGYSGSFYNTRAHMTTFARVSNVMTVNFSGPHGYLANDVLHVFSVGTIVQGPLTVATVPTTTSITFSDTAADASGSFGGSSSIVKSLTSVLNSYDGVYDQFVLQKRATVRRAVQIATLIKTVYGVDFGTKAKVCFFSAPYETHRDPMLYVNTVHGAPSSFFYGIGNATYINLDASAIGGANLRNVSTYNGFTPPAIADYNATFALTAANAKSSDVYDGIAITASIYSLKMLQYEYGPDLTGYPTVGAAGTAAGAQKNSTLFDPSFGATYKIALNDQERHGYEEVAVYNAGMAVVGETSEYGGWAIAHDYTTASARTTAIDQIIAATRTGITRNLLLASGTTVIDGRMSQGNYSATGAYPQAESTYWNITALNAGVYSFVLSVATTDTYRGGNLIVNGVSVAAYVFNATPTMTMAAVNITLKAGTNYITFTNNGSYLGNIVSVVSMTFTI